MKSRPFVVVATDAPDALVRVCGVTMIDRLLRALQRTGFDRAVVLSATPDVIRKELARPSWARAGIEAEVRDLSGASLTFGDLSRAVGQHDSAPLLLLSGGMYFDLRLIEAFLNCEESTALIDSDPKHLQTLGALNRKEAQPGSPIGAFLLEPAYVASQPQEANLFSTISDQIQKGAISALDVAVMPSFQMSMRRRIRPLWFPAPAEAARAMAEELVLDTAQKGAMEMVSYLETPAENMLMRRIWNTSITPMQITLFGVAVGVAATIAFASGHLWVGGFLALVVGVIDGVDGKQARVKVETTELGRWEGEMDYPVQMSWWIALAYYFNRVVPELHAVRWVILFLVTDVADKLFTRWVKQTTGQYLENYSKIDGVVRFFGGPRSLYVCMLICGLIVGQPDRAFVLICGWHAAIACIHGIRAAWICGRDRSQQEI